jgi:two-component system cell cycle sensor histidine kinase PleC
LFITKTVYDRAQYHAQASQAFRDEIGIAAVNVSRTIDTQLAPLQMAMAFSRDPNVIVDLASRSETVQGAAVLDASNRILAESGGAGSALSQINLDGLQDGQTNIVSLTQPSSGETAPVIVLRSQGLYLATILTPGTLIGTGSPDRALVMTSGRIIDGAAAIGSVGSYEYFGIAPNQMAATANRDGISISSSNAREEAWLGLSTVPKSGGSLVVLDKRDRIMPSFLRNNLLMFGLMFMGMAWLIWMLMKQLMQQFDALRATQENDEISSQRYQVALDGTGGGVWEIDLSHNTAFLSASLAKLVGLAERDTQISLPQFLGLFEAGDRDILYNAIRRTHVSGAFNLDLSLAQLPLFIACRGKPSVRGVDQAKVIIGVALDVTETRGTQARLQAAEARLFDALRGMNDSFVIWDQMDRLVLWNRKFEDFFGFEPGNLQAGIEHAIVQHYADQVIAEERELGVGEGSEIQLSDGRWIRYQETYTQDGGRVSIGTEVTAIRSREAELEANRDRLESTINVLRASQSRIVELAENYEQEKIRAEQASQSKSEFLANMSHELRTPLNAINGFSDIMKKEMFGPLGDPRYKEYVSDILFSGQHLLSLINDILDMSKIEAGKMTLNVETLSIDKMIQQVLRIVRGRAEENHLKLFYTPAQAQDIEADPRALKQVLLNLATNAIKFTPEGGSVTIQVDPKATGLIVHVSDTGIGISEEDIARLAQPFEQVDSAHARQHEGTGLGLALSKSLIELHGGNFGISSTIGKGTTVTFTLPNTPIIKSKPKTESEVGDEFSKLAEDIAAVLETGTASTMSAAAGSEQTVHPGPPPMAGNQAA